MMKKASMIITEGDEVYATTVASPQLPGLAAGFDEFPTHEELFDLARWAGLDADGQICCFREFVIPVMKHGQEGSMIIRIPMDHLEKERVQATICALEDKRVRRILDDAIVFDELNDAFIIHARLDDTLGTLLEAFSEGQPFNILIAQEDHNLFFRILNTSSG